MPTFLEFFAGGGMARAGFGEGWTCRFANDNDPRKAASYQANWGGEVLRLADVSTITAADLPTADLAWASFPCQDLSLAGDQAGLRGARSGTFWAFWSLMRALGEAHRAPPVIVLENVCGALTSHQGRDFQAIAEALSNGGYRLGAIVLDALHFLPQSRPRLFVIAVSRAHPLLSTASGPHPLWHPKRLCSAYERLPACLKSAWLWWRLPLPVARTTQLADLLETGPRDVPWHTPVETRRLLSLMNPQHRDRVSEAQRSGQPAAGCIYRRTRRDESGSRVQRAEVRFDGIAGCLRTPAGGSSRQTLLLVEGNSLRSRLFSAREAARLMGLPDTYKLPDRYNDAYHLAGDGVAIPAVRFLAHHLLEPLLQVAR